MKKNASLFILLLLGFYSQAAAVKPVPMQKYLEFARASADWTWDHYDSLVTVWKEKLDPDYVFGFRPPPRLLEMATIYAYLYDKEGKKVYAKRAKKVLLQYGDYRKFYPESAIKKRPDYADGLPALPDFFTTMRYLRPFETLKRHKLFSAKEIGKIQQLVQESMTYLLRTEEWGPMNRGILRAEGLAWAVRAFPDDKDAKTWRMLQRSIGFDSWGNWEIEDASLYNAIWLYSLLGYADAQGKEQELFHTPEMYYYAQYYLNLISPAGMIPDFGDALWMSNWHRYLVFFEAAAKEYNDPQLKWAAATIANKFIDFNNVTNTGLAFLFLDCYRYGTDNIMPKEPTQLSGEVMEDVQGKKIVFRNGWQPNSTYMLLNYKDEGDGGLVFKDYLRDTIPIEEEKTTHGHSDENSIPLLMANGSVLLHDGGYRDYMPSGPFGAYRQDYFHNRLCVRQEKIAMGQKKGQFRYSTRDAVQGQTVLDFLHDAGSYRPVRTQKVDFLTFPDFDYSRTRLVDDDMGYEQDRIITYVKNPEMFIVFDIFKARSENYFTAANLWHTRKILAQGDHWYDTVYDSLRNVALPTDTHLFIYFPKTLHLLEGVEKEKRYYQNELVIEQTAAQHFELGQHIAFVTVLIPHPANESPQKWIDKIKFIEPKPKGAGMMVQIKDGERVITVAAKQDLRMDIVRDWRRPKYTYEAGKIQYGNFETNGDYLFSIRSGKKLSFTITNLIKAKYADRVLFEQKPALYGLAFDGSPDKPGLGKVRYWRDQIIIK